MRQGEICDTKLGVYLADLATTDLYPGSRVEFTFYWTKAGHWEDKNYSVEVT